MNWTTKIGFTVVGVTVVIGGAFGWLAYRHVTTINELHDRCWDHLLKIHDQLLRDGHYFHSDWKARKEMLWAKASDGIESILSGYAQSIQDHVRAHIKYDSRKIASRDLP